MHSLKIISNNHWTENEKEIETQFLKKARNIQRKKSKASFIILVSASIFFSVGFIFVVLVFYKFLSQINEGVIL